jgi:hypothetical protein
MSINLITGNEDAKKVIINQWKRKKSSGTYLLYGKKGADLHEFALAFAKGLNCNELEFDYCDTCRVCNNINKEVYSDLHFIKASESNIKIEQIREVIKNASESSFEKGKYEHNTHENLSRLIISNAFPGYKYVEEVCEIIEKHHIQVVDEKNKNYKEIKKLKFADQEARRLEIKNYLTTKKDTSIINQKPKEPISELVQKEEDNPIKESTPKEEVMDVFNNAENAVKEDTSIVIEAKNEEDKSEQNIKINIDENIEISQAEKPIKLPNNDDIEKENISSEKKVHTIKEDGYNEVLDMEAFGSFIQSLVSSINTTEMTSQKRLRPVSISDKDELFVPVEIYLKLLKNAKFDVSDKKKIDMVTRQLKTDGVLKYETSKIALDGFSNFAYKQRRTYFVFSLDFLNVTQDEVALKKRNEENLRNVSIVRS